MINYSLELRRRKFHNLKASNSILESSSISTSSADIGFEVLNICQYDFGFEVGFDIGFEVGFDIGWF